MRIAVVGGGTWGTTLAVVLRAAGSNIIWWLQRAEQAESIRRENRNSRYLPEVPIPDSITLTTHLAEVVGCDGIFLAVPSPSFEKILRDLTGAGALSAAWVISGTKGVLLGHTERPLLQSDIAASLLPSGTRFCVFSGPNIARYILQGEPTTAVIAGAHEPTLAAIQELLRGSPIRLYRTDDIVGVQIAGSFKNVIAVAAGVAHGMSLHSNTLGALMVRGLLEMQRVGRVYGARPSTFWGSSGLGDVVATAFSPDSRNASLGREIARGKTMDAALRESPRVAEGVFAARAFHELARSENLDLPITAAVYRILFEGLPPATALNELMKRPLKREELEELSVDPAILSNRTASGG
jgi:glycerol-3-phosphate dehydrogenase (NAD(P)+)